MKLSGHTSGVESSVPSRLAVPDAPALVAGQGRAAILTGDGELIVLPVAQAAACLRALAPPLVVHAPATLRRLGMRAIPTLDLLELFAFALPARTAIPTVLGLCLALDLEPPTGGLEAEVTLLPLIAGVLMHRLAAGAHLPGNRDAAVISAWMGRAGWGWAPSVQSALGTASAGTRGTLQVWKNLPEWEETAPPPSPSSHPVGEGEARARLSRIIGPGAEQRPEQADYAGAATAAFAPREQRGDPHLLLAEAGTGTGKTLGYIAPATLWAEKNRGTVWISTFTRHLQRQIEAELSRVFPVLEERRRRVVLRKGRENYLCLLNLEEAVAVARGGLSTGSAIPLGLLLRWIGATRDGDIQGGDLPGWFAELFGAASVLAVADRRGECIHAACPHWRRCFVEHTIRRARTAELVVANHALVMAQAVWGGLDDDNVPSRYVFDEGHHLFDAADGAFAVELSGVETAELRRWLLGAEAGRSRARGLRRRVDDLIVDRPELAVSLDAALQAARALPAPGWSLRLVEEVPELGGIDAGRSNPTEEFLRLARRQIVARLPGADEPPPRGVLESDLYPVARDLALAAERLELALARIEQPLMAFRNRLLARLGEVGENDESDATERNRIEAIGRSLARRAIAPVQAWRAMLRAVGQPPPEPGTRPEYVFYLRLDRREAGDRDVGLHRHWLDPTIPFAATLAQPAQGVLVTSATLRDSGDADPETSWLVAESRVGAPHLPSPAIRIAVASPFDYAAQTRTIIVTDIPGRRTSLHSLPPIEACSSRLAAAASACSPPSAGCKPSTPGSHRNWRRLASRCSPSMSIRWTTPRWWTSFASTRRVACSAPMRCGTAWTCPAVPFASSSSSGCHGRGRISCIASGGCISRAATRKVMTTVWPGCVSVKPSAA